MDRRQFFRRACEVTTVAASGAIINDASHHIEQRIKDSTQVLKSEIQKELDELKTAYAAMDKRSKLMMRALLALAGIDLFLII